MKNINHMLKMLKMFSLTLTLTLTNQVVQAMSGVKLVLRAGTDQRFFTAIYTPNGQNVTWSPTMGRGTDSIHEWGPDACGGRLALLVGTEPTEIGSFAIPSDCSGKEYRLEVEETADSTLQIVLRSVR